MVNGPAAIIFFNQVENLHQRAVVMANGVDKVPSVYIPQMSHIVSEILKNTEHLEYQIKNSHSLTSRQFNLLHHVVLEVKQAFVSLKEFVGKTHASKKCSDHQAVTALNTPLEPVKVRLSMAIAGQKIFTRALDNYSLLLNRHLKLLEGDVVRTTYRDLDNCKVRSVNMAFKLKIFQKIIEYTPDLTRTAKTHLAQTTREQLIVVQSIFKNLSKNSQIDVDSLDVTEHALKLKSHIDEINDKISHEAQVLLKEVTDMIIAETEQKSPGKGVLLTQENVLVKETQNEGVGLSKTNEQDASCVVC